MKAVRLKSSGKSVGRRMIYGGKDLWNRCVLSLEWKRESSKVSMLCSPHWLYSVPIGLYMKKTG